MLASWFTSLYALPFWILIGLLLLFGIFALLGRIAGGRFLKPIITAMAKVPLLRRWLARLSEAAMRKQNPDLASAIKKMERSGAMNDPMKAQAAMSRMTAQERRALMDATAQQQEAEPEALNREQRRRLEKARREAQRRGGR
jgi:hypothetical protein